jgi:hypothetical protein
MDHEPRIKAVPTDGRWVWIYVDEIRVVHLANPASIKRWISKLKGQADPRSYALSYRTREIVKRRVDQTITKVRQALVREGLTFRYQLSRSSCSAYFHLGSLGTIRVSDHPPKPRQRSYPLYRLEVKTPTRPKVGSLKGVIAALVEKTHED